MCNIFTAALFSVFVKIGEGSLVSVADSVPDANEMERTPGLLVTELEKQLLMSEDVKKNVLPVVTEISPKMQNAVKEVIHLVGNTKFHEGEYHNIDNLRMGADAKQKRKAELEVFKSQRALALRAGVVFAKDPPTEPALSAQEEKHKDRQENAVLVLAAYYLAGPMMNTLGPEDDLVKGYSYLQRLLEEASTEKAARESYLNTREIPVNYNERAYTH